jgi:hypothetical protein
MQGVAADGLDASVGAAKHVSIEQTVTNVRLRDETIEAKDFKVIVGVVFFNCLLGGLKSLRKGYVVTS